jgi:hypothetical protein
MEIGVPTYNALTTSYAFRILKSDHVLEQTIYYEGVENVDLPASPGVAEAFVREFLEKTKKYFTNPLQVEKVLRHLRHVVATGSLPKTPSWYSLQWKPSSFVVKTGDFALTWEVVDFKETMPVIPAEFTASTTPRAHSPEAPEQTPQEIRKIQIHDSLIPVGDLPLSDLPPLFFGREEDEVDPAREEIRRRIREARLKAQLAKLKAQRMEQKYFERYGQPAEDSEESSEFSSDSEEGGEVSFERHSHA